VSVGHEAFGREEVDDVVRCRQLSDPPDRAGLFGLAGDRPHLSDRPVHLASVREPDVLHDGPARPAWHAGEARTENRAEVTPRWDVEDEVLAELERRRHRRKHYKRALGHHLGRMSERLATNRLVLQPLSRETARAVVEGRHDGLERGDGWPHDDTLDALGMVAEHGSEAWLILEDGVVVGDAGTHGPPDEHGDVEIGYGLAAPARGRGLSSEFVPALAQHLLARPGVKRIVAREVLAGNLPSRRALERAGFELEREADGLTWYALEPVGE
jgi:RimJ/RimL family protein N-acetyltransferase